MSPCRILLAISVVGFAASAQAAWPIFYNGAGNSLDRPDSIATDDNGNVYVGGVTTTNSGIQMLVLKFSKTGGMVWSKTYNSSALGTDFGPMLAVAPTGTVYAGWVSRNTSAAGNALIIRLGTNGNEIWAREFDVTGDLDVPTDLQLGKNGGVVVAGYSNESGTGSHIFATSYNAAGDRNFLRYYGSGSVQTRPKAAVGLNGDVYAVGTIDSKVAIAGYKPDGSPKFSIARQVISGQSCEAIAMKLDKNGNLVVAGTTDNSGDRNVCALRFGTGGVVQWSTAILSSDPWEFATDLAIDSHNNACISAFGGASSAATDWQTIKLSGGGDFVWKRVYDGSNTSSSPDQTRAIAVDDDDNIIVTGRMYFGGSVDLGTFTDIKYSPGGNRKWVRTFVDGSKPGGAGLAITVDATSNHVFTAGIRHNGQNDSADIIVTRN